MLGHLSVVVAGGTESASSTAIPHGAIGGTCAISVPYHHAGIGGCVSSAHQTRRFPGTTLSAHTAECPRRFVPVVGCAGNQRTARVLGGHRALYRSIHATFLVSGGMRGVPRPRNHLRLSASLCCVPPYWLPHLRIRVLCASRRDDATGVMIIRTIPRRITADHFEWWWIQCVLRPSAMISDSVLLRDVVRWLAIAMFCRSLAITVNGGRLPSPYLLLCYRGTADPLAPLRHKDHIAGPSCC